MRRHFSDSDRQALAAGLKAILSNDRYPFSIEDRELLQKCIEQLEKLDTRDWISSSKKFADIAVMIARIFNAFSNFTDLF